MTENYLPLLGDIALSASRIASALERIAVVLEPQQQQQSPLMGHMHSPAFDSQSRMLHADDQYPGPAQRGVLG